MKVLKSLLRSNVYLILLIISIFFAIFLNKRDRESSINQDVKEIVGIVKKISVDFNKISFIININKENILCNYYIEDKLNIKLGDKVLVNGELKQPTNNTVFNNFNYKNYLKQKNIFYIMTVDDIKKLHETDNLLYKIKNFFIKRIEKFNVSDYLYTFILGNKDYLSDNVYESYRNNGVVHLFAISGTHITLLVSIILYIFKKIKLNIVISYFIVFLLLFFYMFLTDYGASVLRSGFFFILLGLKKLNYLKLNTIDVFYLTIIILLLVNYHLLYDIGFLYSASISYGLLISKRLINGNYIKKVFVISFISTLISLPITINNFYEINLLGIIYNIFFVPIVSFLVTPLAFIVLLCPFLESIFLVITNILEFVSLNLNYLQFNLVVPKMNFISIIMYYFIVYLFLTKKNFYLLYIIFLIVMVKIIFLVDNNYYVYYLDVSQGDSTLIKYKNDIVLIDTGGVIMYDSKSEYRVSDKIITFIKSLGFNSIDYLILTHGDYDHMGDAINLVDHFKVEKVIFNCGEFNELELDLIKDLDKKKIPYYSCINELNINNNKLYFLNNGNYDNENDDSSVIYIELNNYKFLFMGDAGVEVEKDLIQKYNLKNIDVLKVGHHGSKTSSSIEFINEINPKYSIISVGKNNRYGHPNKEVLDNLKGSKTYRTDKQGSIMFKIKNDKLQIGTCTP